MQESGNTTQSWKWTLFMSVFGIGMVVLCVNLIGRRETSVQYVFELVAAMFVAISSFIIGVIEFFDFIRERKQLMADITCYSEYKRQQPEDTIEINRYARHIFTEHSKNMFWEIYWHQVEASLVAGWMIMLICGVCAALTQHYLFYILIVFSALYMFNGFTGISCRLIKQQIKDQNLDMRQVKRDYMKGVVYAFASGYFNVCPHYTFIIRGKDTAVIRNEELLRISENIHQTKQYQTGIYVGTIKNYSVTISTKAGKSYTVTCEATVGSLIVEAVNRKIQECNRMWE